MEQHRAYREPAEDLIELPAAMKTAVEWPHCDSCKRQTEALEASHLIAERAVLIDIDVISFNCRCILGLPPPASYSMISTPRMRNTSDCAGRRGTASSAQCHSQECLRVTDGRRPSRTAANNETAIDDGTRIRP
jgi:hypothetical protein